jgi:hypothetical protein
MSTGVGITLVAAGAILRFAVPATLIHGLNVHVISVIVMLVGVFGLLLSLMVWGPLSRRRNHSGGNGRGRSRSPGSVYARLRLRLLWTPAAPDNPGRPGGAP